MATIDTLITDLRTWTDTDSTILTGAQCATFINETIHRIERNHPYRDTFTAAALTVPTTGSVALPANFIGEFAVWEVITGAPAHTRLKEIRRVEHKRKWYTGTTGASDPQYPQVGARSLPMDDRVYWIEAGQLTIAPTPTTALSVQLDYAAAQTDLVAASGGTNPFTLIYPDVVRLGALRDVSLYLHEYEAAATFEQLFQLAVTEAIRRDEAITAAGPTPVRGR